MIIKLRLMQHLVGCNVRLFSRRSFYGRLLDVRNTRSDEMNRPDMT